MIKHGFKVPSIAAFNILNIIRKNDRKGSLKHLERNWNEWVHIYIVTWLILYNIPSDSLISDPLSSMWSGVGDGEVAVCQAAVGEVASGEVGVSKIVVWPAVVSISGSSVVIPGINDTYFHDFVFTSKLNLAKNKPKAKPIIKSLFHYAILKGKNTYSHYHDTWSKRLGFILLMLST